MNRRFANLLFAALLLCGFAPRLKAEVSTVTIRTNLPYLSFAVDGIIYRENTTFTWADGTQHVISIPFERDGLIYGTDEDERRFNFTGWTDDGGSQIPTSQFTITAGYSSSLYTANFKVQYKVHISFAELPILAGNGALCGVIDPNVMPVKHVGAVFVNGNCYWGDAAVWMDPGPVNLSFIPYPGYAFVGWAVDGGQPNPNIRTVNVNSSTWIRPTFAVGRKISFATEPAGLNVIVDGGIVVTPQPDTCPPQQVALPFYDGPLPCRGDLWFAPGSTHILSGQSPQQDALGHTYVFESWLNGAGNDHVYTTGLANTAERWTARYVRATWFRVISEPAGLGISIDGITAPEVSSFLWGVGMKHVVNAPDRLTDAAGRVYIFKGWSNGGANTQEISPTQEMVDAGGHTLVAKYEIYGRAVIQASVGGIKLTVNGNECASPCVLDQPAGTKVTATAPALGSDGPNTRYEFTGWSDGAKGALSLTLSDEYHVYTANYQTFHKLVTQSDPDNGVDTIVDPASADGFYLADTHLTVTAKPRDGFKFIRWEGDIAAAGETGTVYMDHAKLVRAILKRVPFISSTGVRNAAGETPETGVAAGSLIAILGQSLAPEYQAGPSNPLASTIGGVAVRLDDRVLPLVSVSPEQVIALLPSDLPEGEYGLAVNGVGYPEVAARFTVVRNAPGLFSTDVNGKAVVNALHEDGSLVTIEKPAKRGERITLLGTGLGAYDKRPVDGFAATETPLLTLIDKAEVVSGDLHLPVIWAGAQPGLTGITGIRFRIADQLKSGLNDLLVTVATKNSNLVVLPVE